MKFFSEAVALYLWTPVLTQDVMALSKLCGYGIVTGLWDASLDRNSTKNGTLHGILWLMLLRTHVLQRCHTGYDALTGANNSQRCFIVQVCVCTLYNTQTAAREQSHFPPTYQQFNLGCHTLYDALTEATFK